MGYNGYTEKKKVSNQKYAEKFERPHLRMTAEEKILIEKAAAKLLSTDESVTDIAYSCGFNDLSYFIKVFKDLKGISPKQFRKDKS